MTISRESAEEALRQQDWLKAWEYWGAVREAGGPADEWLHVMEGAALPHATAGDLAAQQNLGSIGSALYMIGAPGALESLERSLKWVVAALRQEMSATGLQMLIVGYGALHERGVHAPDIEAYLSEPEPREAWRKWSGMETLP